MKKLLTVLVVTVLANAAFAKVDPSQPMVTGRGNVAALPGRVLITNQTKSEPEADKAVQLTKFEVTGSLLRPTAKATLPAKR
jgi:hypothetical protein